MLVRNGVRYIEGFRHTYRLLLFLSAGLPRQDFENKEVTFESHITNEHNLWHYLDFIVHLHTKDKTEFTGPESYVYKMITVSQSVLVFH